MTHSSKCVFPLLAAYVRMWAVGTCVRTLSRSGRELVLNEMAAGGAAIAFCFPLNPLALLVGFGLRVLALLISLPYVHDSQNVRTPSTSSSSPSSPSSPSCCCCCCSFASVSENTGVPACVLERCMLTESSPCALSRSGVCTLT